MKKILIFLLLLVNLNTGLAYAWSSSPEVVFGHENSIVNFITGEEPNHPNKDPHNEDHFCHGSAHIVGIFNEMSEIQKVNTSNEFPSFNVTSQTRYIHPLFRPPIA